jgi:hypothetical protein
MSLDDRLDRVRDELADEVAADVRVPSFAGVLARRARRRRLQATAGGAALVVVAAGVVGGIAATRPSPHRSVPPVASVSVSPPPSGSRSASPTTPAPSEVQTYPEKGSAYVVVPDGDQLAWTDLATGSDGHFGPADGNLLADPSVSADGRRLAYVDTSTATSGASHDIDFWDIDTRSGGTLATIAGPSVVSAPSISPDGKRVAFVSGSSLRIATIGSRGVPASVLLQGGTGFYVVSWTGNDAIAYAPLDAGSGGDCAVEQVVAIAQPVTPAGTRCLLPTATLQSVFASDGSTWRIDSISGAADGSVLALGVTTTNQSQHGIGLLTTKAEATPFRVLPATIVTESSPLLNLGPPVALDGRVLYQQAQGGGNAHVLSVDLATGEKTEVTAAFGGDLQRGLGATSG